MKRSLTVDEFADRRLREAVIALVKHIDGDQPLPPDNYDRLLAMIRELRTPTLTKLSQVLADFTTRLEEVENTVKSIVVATGGRVRTLPVSPNRLGV